MEKTPELQLKRLDVTNECLDIMAQLGSTGPFGNKWFKVNLHVHAEGIEPKELVAKANQEHIDVVAITDHQTFEYYEGVKTAADGEKTNTSVFLPGIEITCLEGVHLLAVFPLTFDSRKREHFLGWLEVSGSGATNQASRKKVSEVLKKIDEENGVTITPHPFSDGIGLLDSARKLSTKMEWLESGFINLIQISEDKIKFIDRDDHDEWINRYILASCPPDQVAESKYCLAPFNRSDSHSLDDIANGCSWFRMSEASINGFKQVACEPKTRISRTTPPTNNHDCILAIKVTGGFCDGQLFQFNDQLNCVIGQNHAGKSAVFDFIRFALGNIHTDARLFRRIQAILGPSGIVEVFTKSDSTLYLSRRVFNPTFDGDMQVIGCTNPSQHYRFDAAEGTLVPVSKYHMALEVYEQGRIGRLREDIPHQLVMLDEFAKLHDKIGSRTTAIDNLTKSAEKLAPLYEEEENLLTEISAKAQLQKELTEKSKLIVDDDEKKWTQAGHIAESLAETQRVLTASLEKLQQTPEPATLEVESDFDVFRQSVPEITDSDTAEHETLKEWGGGLKETLERIQEARTLIEKAIAEGQLKTGPFKLRWESSIQNHNLQNAKKLAAAGVESPEEVIGRVSSLKQKLNDIATKKRPRLTAVQEAIKAEEEVREKSLSEIENLSLEITQARSEKASELTKQLEGQIQIKLRPNAELKPYREILSALCTDVTSQKQKIQNKEQQLELIIQKIQPIPLARSLRNDGMVVLEGGLEIPLAEYCGVTPNTVAVLQLIANDVSLRNQLETIIVEDVPTIGVRRAGEQEYADLRTGLSPGEQSAAILTLALQARVAPLIVDQPEDELGYNYVVHLIVPKILEAKSHRQILMITHNANIPVLGDADYVVKMENRPAKQGTRECVVATNGCFEDRAVTDALLELEGGIQAFRFRTHRYTLPMNLK